MVNKTNIPEASDFLCSARYTEETTNNKQIYLKTHDYVYVCLFYAEEK